VQTERQPSNKKRINFVDIYKTAYSNSGFTVMCSGIISLCIIIFYALFSLIYNSIQVEIYLSTIEMLLAILGVGLVTGLILPFVYSFFACYQVLKTEDKDDVSIKSFFKTYILGINPPFRNALSNLKTIVLAFSLYVLINLFAIIIVSIVATSTTGPLHELYEELSALNFNSSSIIEEMDSIILKYEEDIYVVSTYVEFFSLIFAGYYYIHTISRNTFKYFYAMLAVKGNRNSMNMVNFIYKKSMRGHFFEYHKSFYKILWPATLVYFVGFTLIYRLSLTMLKLDLVIVCLTSFIVPLAILTLILPVLFELHDRLFATFQRYYFSTASEIFHSQYNDFLKRGDPSATNVDIKEVEKSLNDLDEFLDRSEEEDKDKKDN